MGDIYSDKHLQYLLTTWNKQFEECRDKLTKSILHVVLHVGNEIANQRAVLLPGLSKIFLNEYLASAQSVEDDIIVESDEGSIKFTSKWLLKHLVMHLHTHMDYKCVHYTKM